jgi:hypothetical protein
MMVGRNVFQFRMPSGQTGLWRTAAGRLIGTNSRPINPKGCADHVGLWAISKAALRTEAQEVKK